MKKITILAVLGAVVFCSCTFATTDANGSNFWSNVFAGDDESVRTTRTYDLGDFTGIRCDAGCEIDYEMSSTPSIRISAGEATMDKLDVKIEDGVLVIGIKKGRIRSEVDVMVSSSSLKSLYVNGAVDFESKRGIVADNFDCTVNGACDIEIDGLTTDSLTFQVNGAGDMDFSHVNCKTIEGSINGAGEVEISGRAEHADVAVNGVGEVDLKDLVCPDKTTSANGITRRR